MNSKDYFKKVNDFIDNLSDEEFDKLLKESGLEKCPYEEKGTVILDNKIVEYKIIDNRNCPCGNCITKECQFRDDGALCIKYKKWKESLK